MNQLSYYHSIIGKGDARQVSLIEQDISGGKISKSTIDSLGDHGDKDILTISGLTQDTFEYLIDKFGRQFRVINFWKCPRVEDFSPLESLGNVEYITYFWNQRATRLWDFRKTPKLLGFGFDDFTRLHDLKDLEGAVSLIELEFGDKIWTKYEVDSLAPLARLPNLEHLAFSAKTIADGRIEPIAQLKKLKTLSFPGPQFTTEQVAWLKAHLPDSVESKVLAPFWMIKQPLGIGGKEKDTFVVGKRKPFLDSVRDAKRIEKYVQEFNARVQWFRMNPDKLPEDYC